MKNVKIYLRILMGVFLITSCTNNDDTTNFAADIEGEWRLTSLESINSHDFNNDGEPSNNILLETNCYLNEVMVFNANNTANLKTTSFTEIIATLIPGTTNDYTYATGCINEEDLIIFNWKIGGDNIILINNEDVETEILSVNNNQFSFMINKSLVVNKSSDQTVLIEEDLKFTYTRE